ncbi:MAG TPA: hypothetical protein VKQ27_04650 [Acetobacteraceae bacterium]|nr:hypothetical protein [Acetobacteraceae bacterium]
MIGTRSALLVASIFVAGPAIAATPSDGHYVWVPAGEAVVVAPKAPTRPIAFPVVDMLARQEAMMQRIMADMDTMMAIPLPNPDQIMQAAMQGMPQLAPGSSVVVTSISIPGGTCSQTITYGATSQGVQPVVKVVSSGNACGAIQANGPISVVQSTPIPQPAAQQPQQRLWTIGYPQHPITTGVRPRT